MAADASQGFDPQAAADRRARVFGHRPMAVGPESGWRSGPPGRLTQEEMAEGRRSLFGPRGPEQQQLAARVAECRRQVAAEQRALRLIADRGWEAAKASGSGVPAELVESLRSRLGGGTSTGLREAAKSAVVEVDRLDRAAGLTQVQEAGRSRWGG